MGAKSANTEDTVAHGEVTGRCADYGDLTRQLAAKDLPLWPAQPKEDSHKEWMRAAPTTIRAVAGGRMGLDKDLVILGDRTLDLGESLDIGGPIPVVD
jgi:hypothetical protein